MKLIYIVFIGVLLTSCTSSDKKILKNYMIGSWQTEYMKVEMPTVNKSDSLYVFEDDFSKPKADRAQSNYKKDGTFTAWFMTYDGKKVAETNGKWHTKSDSLFVDYLYGNKPVKAWYLITQTANGFEGKAVYDWDSDGEFDDTLFMKSKRLDQD